MLLFKSNDNKRRFNKKNDRFIPEQCNNLAGKTLMFYLYFLFAVLILSACTNPLGDGLSQSTFHTNGWSNNSEHGEMFTNYPENCMACHGDDLQGGQADISCLNCHHNGGWDDNSAHGEAFSTDSYLCKACHGEDLNGGLVNYSCFTCHHGEGSSNWGNEHGNGYSTYPDRCKGCHGEDLNGGLSKISCDSCHHGTDTNGGHASQTCDDCHSTNHDIKYNVCMNACHNNQSHATHFDGTGKGPGMPYDLNGTGCFVCHSNAQIPDLKGDACDNCHSPGGDYDGVDDPGIGALANWQDGIYNETGDALKTGKEQWCVGCHDGGPAVIDGVTAPDVGLFWNSGHGRNNNVACLDCHDVTVTHIDDDARTYAFNSSYYSPSESGVAYAAGYRLKYVGGEVPLMIPVNYNITFSSNGALMRDTAFRMCFNSGCHDSSMIFDDTPGDGINSNFKACLPNPPRDYSYAWGSGAVTNEHVSHMLNYIIPNWDSDWDTETTGAGGSVGRDSLTACSSCHNVHGAVGTEGSTNEVMIRDGSLAGRSGYDFSYVIENIGAGGYPWVTSTGATQSNSIGSIFRNNTANMCGGSMCHGNPAPPAGSSYDASGSSWGTYVEYYRPWQQY